METIEIKYNFICEDFKKREFSLSIDAKTLVLKNTPKDPLPEWTLLDFHKCSMCSLSSETEKHCPLSVNLIDLVKGFMNLFSYDKTYVEVTTPQRLLQKNTTVQEGVSSLMGLYIATSRCPQTNFFKPMARFHLPFASEEETIYRVVSTYLLAEYVLDKEPQSNKNRFDGLIKIYDNIQVLNLSIVERLRSASKKDSTINALIILDLFAKSLPHTIEESFEEYRHLFEPFFKNM